ncbi:MAG: hypothetical protein ABSA44_00175 [Bacteroidota bacterium]|jgi:hypothetical protein
MVSNIDSQREIVRHTIATMVYRGAKTLRGAPLDFEKFRINPQSRTPVEIVAHIGDLFDWALTIAKGHGVWHDSPPQAWDREVARFYASVKEFDTYLAGDSTITCPLEKLIQGPIADAITHVGQLAMLRHLFGAPIRGENYFLADIAAGRVGPEQSKPRREFD